MVQKLKDFAGEGGKYFGELTNAVTGIADQKFIRRRFLLGRGKAKAASFVGVNVDVGAVIQRVGGVVENPNLELLFNGPGLRTFSFQIDLLQEMHQNQYRKKNHQRVQTDHGPVKEVKLRVIQTREVPTSFLELLMSTEFNIVEEQQLKKKLRD